MSSSNGLFPEIGFRFVESLGAGSFSDVAETHLYTIFLFVLHLKNNECKIMWKINNYFEYNLVILIHEKKNHCNSGKNYKLIRFQTIKINQLSLKSISYFFNLKALSLHQMDWLQTSVLKHNYQEQDCHLTYLKHKYNNLYIFYYNCKMK